MNIKENQAIQELTEGLKKKYGGNLSKVILYFTQVTH